MRLSIFASLVVLVVLSSAGVGYSYAAEVSITSTDSLREITLSCSDGKTAFSINWGQRVGAMGKKRRHLFYRSGGDEHVMLPVLDASGTVTGYADNSELAQALIAHILGASRHDAVLIGVFPAGSDPVSGDWINAVFDFDTFSKAAKRVAQLCGWDLAQALKKPHALDTKLPTPPGYGDTSPDED
jgi:hypothetical protein